MNDPLGKCSYPCEAWPDCGCGYQSVKSGPQDYQRHHLDALGVVDEFRLPRESERLVLDAWVAKAVKLDDVAKRATPWRTVIVTPREPSRNLEIAFVKSRQCGLQSAWFTVWVDDDDHTEPPKV